MDSNTIASEAIKTAMLLPVVILLATILISYLVSFFSLRKSEDILKIGLVSGVLAFALSTFIIAINYITLLD